MTIRACGDLRDHPAHEECPGWPEPGHAATSEQVLGRLRVIDDAGALAYVRNAEEAIEHVGRRFQMNESEPEDPATREWVGFGGRNAAEVAAWLGRPYRPTPEYVDVFMLRPEEAVTGRLTGVWPGSVLHRVGHLVEVLTADNPESTVQHQHDKDGDPRDPEPEPEDGPEPEGHPGPGPEPIESLLGPEFAAAVESARASGAEMVAVARELVRTARTLHRP